MTQKHLESRFFNHRWVKLSHTYFDEKGQMIGTDVWLPLSSISYVEVIEDAVMARADNIKEELCFFSSGNPEEEQRAALYLLREIEFAHGRMPIPSDM